MSKQETYQSSTHGNIPLSFTGRRLLANERDAVENAIKEGSFTADNMQLSRVRGELAQYMSKLEQREPLTVLGCDWGAAEARTLKQQSADEFLNAAREFNEARAKLLRCAEQAKHVGLKPTWTNPTARHALLPRTFRDGVFPTLQFEVSRTITEFS
jgi:hypothetical protein